MKHNLHLLIIHYNNPHALGLTLTSYLTYGVDHENIHVFDNGSIPDKKKDLAQLQSRYRVNVIYSDVNLGWGKAINRFIASTIWSDDDLLGISAHDTLLEKADWIVLDEEFADKAVLFVCPQYPAPLEYEYSAARSFRCKPASDIARAEVVVGHATLCFVRPKVIARISYDESCFIYGCESEIFLRAHDAKYKTIVTNRIIAENAVTDSSSEFCTLAFGINSIYIAKLRYGSIGYLSRIMVTVFSVFRLALQGKTGEISIKCKALLFSLRSGGAGFNEYLKSKNRSMP